MEQVGSAITLFGVVLTLWSHRLWRLRTQRWKRRLLKFLGRKEPVRTGGGTAVVAISGLSGSAIALEWDRDWSVDEKFEEIVRRIDRAHRAIQDHKHQDTKNRLDRLAAEDKRLSDTIDQWVAELRADEVKSDRFAVAGLLTTTTGVLVMVAAGLLG